MFEPMALELRVFNLDLCQGLHGRGMLDLLCEEKTLCTVRSYWSEQLIAGNKMEKSSDEPPTDQEHRPGDRADQAHRVQLTARSIISFGCLIVGEFRFRFCLLFLQKDLF